MDLQMMEIWECKKIIFYPQKQLIRLFETSGLGIDEMIEGFVPESMMKFDVHTSLLSLPYLLGLKGNRVFESPEGYLRADDSLVEDFKARFFDNDKFGG